MTWGCLMDPAPDVRKNEYGSSLLHGVRLLTVDAALLGVSRRVLLARTDLDTARDIMTRVGRVQGWRTAGRVRPPGRAHAEILRTVTDVAEAMGLGSSAVPGLAEVDLGLLWHHSIEAQHHRQAPGASSDPVCWFLAGFFGGYWTRALARATECVEHVCTAQGSTSCRFELRALSHDRLRPTRHKRQAALKVDTVLVHPEAFEDTLPDDDEPDAAGLGARSAHMREVVSQASRAAGADSTVLITGESGVGKDRLARFIHERSHRAGRVLLPLNCGAVGDTSLLESELFGHRKGAFTGATEEHVGLFEAAQGGTLFLDEIGDVTPAVQVKLLRVLQEREIRRVGDTQYRRINVRLIAATNRDLFRDVREGRFRADLFYRLNVVAIHVPPLRERREDLRLLLRRVLTRTARDLGRPIDGYTPRAVGALLRYPWPGNIRELENALVRACLLAEGPQIDLPDLPEEIRTAVPLLRTEPDTPFLRDVERAHILRVLHSSGGNKKMAAARLGISESTLHRKLHSYVPDAPGRARATGVLRVDTQNE